MDHPRPWLRYVDADDLDDSRMSFDDLTVESNSGEKLGDVDGFVIDVNSGRPYYVVVDAGGWFKSKYFLLPIGHLGFDANGRKLTADVTRERIDRYPGFDRGEFEKLSQDELSRMDTQMVTVCCPDEAVDVTATDRYDRWSHYRTPTWWDTSYYRGDLVETGASGGGTTLPARDEVRARRDPEREDRDAVVARGGDVSPHLGGRAQPGDVMGIETGGEQTHIGDTDEDENNRRRDAEETAAKGRKR